MLISEPKERQSLIGGEARYREALGNPHSDWRYLDSETCFDVADQGHAQSMGCLPTGVNSFVAAEAILFGSIFWHGGTHWLIGHW